MRRHPVFGYVPDSTDTHLCFVLMPFKEVWSRATWGTIRSALAHYGVTCRRADDFHGQIIIEDIWKAINDASLIIADVTRRNANVFYELGIAHTLGKDVLLLTQSTGDIPFDTNRFRHIVYRRSKKGFDALKTAIVASLQERGLVAAPLPERLNIEAPSPKIGRIAGRFLGMWEGSWRGEKRGSLKHVLVIEKMRRTEAHVIYAWGDSDEWGIRAGYRRRRGVLRGRSLFLQRPGVNIEYSLDPAQQLIRAIRRDVDGTFTAVLKKTTIDSGVVG
jgi:hypothetical protein